MIHVIGRCHFVLASTNERENSFIMIRRLRTFIFSRLGAQGKSNLKNSFWGSVDFIVTTGSVFLLIPVLLSTIGQEMFGVMVIVNTMMGFSGMFGFGLGQATLKFVSDYRAREEEGKIAEVVRTTLWVYFLTGLLAFLIMFMAAGWLAESVFNVSEDQVEDALFAIRAGGLGFLSFLVFGVAENTYKGFEQFKRPVVFRSFVRLLTLSGQIVLALSGFGLAYLVGLQVLLYLFGACVLFIRLKRELVTQLSFLPWISWSTLKTVFSYGFYTYLSGLFGLLRQNGDTLLVGAILGPSALALYTIPIRLLSQVHALLSRAYGFLFPYVSKLHAHGDREGLVRCYEQSTFQISVISAGLITPIAVLAYPILALWLGDSIAAQAGGVMQVMALRFAIFPLSIVNAYFLMGSGQVKVMSLVTAVNALFSLSVIASFAYYFGLWGAALGQLSVFIPVLINRFIIEWKVMKVRCFFRVVMPPFLGVFPCIFFYAYNLLEIFPVEHILRLTSFPIWCIFASGFVAAALCGFRRLSVVGGNSNCSF